MKSKPQAAPSNPYSIRDISRDPKREVRLLLGTQYYEKALITTFVGDAQTWDTWHVHARKAGYGRVPMQFVGNFPTKAAAIAAGTAY